MQDESFTVFLDTNIFIKASYNFQSGKLATISKFKQIQIGHHRRN